MQESTGTKIGNCTGSRAQGLESRNVDAAEVTHHSKSWVTAGGELVAYALLGALISGCASPMSGGRGKGQQGGAVPCLPCPVAPQSDCNRTLGEEERKTSAAAYTLYFNANGQILFGEDMTNAQCRVVTITIVPETPPCPASKPWLCGTPPNTFCSAVKYPGCV
jgi:hypothetical protein